MDYDDIWAEGYWWGFVLGCLCATGLIYMSWKLTGH